jgi:hypothetical protein
VCDLETSKTRRLKAELGCCLKEEEEEKEKFSAFLCSVVAAFALVGFQGETVVVCLSAFRENLSVPSSRVKQSKFYV